MNTEVMFSSATDDWPTPQAFFDHLNREFRFELDPCASADNAKCYIFFTKEQNGLERDWFGTVFMNPPYGETIGQWVRKAKIEAAKGCTVVCLVPARTDTAWWHENVMCADEVRFVRGRLKFGDAESSAPFPSAVVVFRPPRKTPAISTQEWRGAAPLFEGRGLD